MTFAVFGNPIKHSKSAEIYSLFSNEAGISTEYHLKLIQKYEDFDHVLYDFFKKGGLGANITVPFKERAFYICDQLTDRAQLSQSVNTIKKKDNGNLLGDNTDGIGFISDLKRLNWMIDNNFLQQTTVEKTEENVNYNDHNNGDHVCNVLLIGAGGAAKGITYSILNIDNNNIYIYIVNRTFSRAQDLVRFYHNIGYKNISCLSLEQLQYSNKNYSLIINSTSSSMNNDLPEIPMFLIRSSTMCYDVFYQKKNTIFLEWCIKNGSHYCSDGLGMLVEQAAYSFYLWHDFFPSTNCVLQYLRSVL